MFTREELLGWAEDMFPGIEQVSAWKPEREPTEVVIASKRKMPARYQVLDLRTASALQIDYQAGAAKFTFFETRDGTTKWKDLPHLGWQIVRPNGERYTITQIANEILEIQKEVYATRVER